MPSTLQRAGFLLALCAFSAAPAAAAPAAVPPRLQALEISPREAELVGSRATRQILVTGAFSDGRKRDLTELAIYRSTRPSVAAVGADGRIAAVADGAGMVEIRVGALRGWVHVACRGSRPDAPISFRDGVIPVLSRAGCNQGACHGAQIGKGGFRLSLLGYDPEADYPVLTREGESRRIVRTEPQDSLLLQKATLGVPHAGGMRFRPDSPEYRILASWIADGCPGPRPGDASVRTIEVFPAESVLRAPAGGKPEVVALPQDRGPARLVSLQPRQRLAAVARYDDGTVRDITGMAQYNTLNDGVARVDENGRVEINGAGATAVMVRFRGQAAVARFVAPYREAGPLTGFTPRGFVDELVAARWRQMGLTPSPPATDAEFIRRVYGDVLGILPTPDEIRAFLGSTDPARREKLVEQVLARPEYADYWTLKWGDLLRNSRDKLGEKGMWSFYNWLRASFRENKPLDRFARELITAQGSTFTTGPANYFRVVRAPADLAETTSQVFLGVRLACARCHHHPFEKWSQDDYWQMAAFFQRVGLKSSDEFGIFGGEQVVRLLPTGETSNPRSGKRMLPTPLDGQPSDDPVDRRRPLAAWLTSPQNPLFARNLVNRYWAYLMGRGLVDPVDDMRVTNPPSNPELLDALARDFASRGFDARHLLRTIINSAAYQLASTPTPENRRDELFYSHYTARRMAAEELLDAISFATGAQEKFPNLPPGMRAVQLPDPGVQSYFLDTFGRPERAIACECERSVEPNMAQALHLMNSDFVQNKVTAADGRLVRLIAAKKSDDEILEELYLVTFSRPPSDPERQRARAAVTQAPERKEGLEDLLWALLNSREFLFKH